MGNGSFSVWGYSDVNKSHFSKVVNDCNVHLNQAKENGMLSSKCYAAMDHGDSVKKDLETCRDDVYSVCEIQMPQDLGQWFSSKEGREIYKKCMFTLWLAGNDGNLSANCTSIMDHNAEWERSKGGGLDDGRTGRRSWKHR